MQIRFKLARPETVRRALPFAPFAAAFGLCFAGLVAAGPAIASGGGGGGSSGGGGNGGNSGSSSSSDMTTCPRGQVWDTKSGRCLKAQAGVLPDDALTDYAFALAKAKRYDEALQVLDLLHNPNTPKALNYRGYATRKLGRVDEGIGYYLKSIALDPHYPQVREYLGEAYVLKGDAPKAQAQLSAIKGICGTGCEPYQDLAEAIHDPASLKAE